MNEVRFSMRRYTPATFLFMVAGCQAPLEIDTHHIKSTTSALDFRRV
ncbi:hypothetical protein [Streptococcus parasuis]|nr:hypothetical protein [Streptococcus parasuis]